MITRSKVRGMFLGMAVGDQLGSVAESKSPEYVAEKFGRITEYQAGCRVTDDTQLTLATAEALIAGGLDMEVQAEKHIEAFKISTAGWGGTTRTAIRNLTNGANWKTSGVGNGTKGTGNGVVMKLSPVAIALRCDLQNALNQEFVRNYTTMTHRTEMAICASFAHIAAIGCCLNSEFVKEKFIDGVIKASRQGEQLAEEIGLPKEKDRITNQFESLVVERSPEEIRLTFGSGSCYVYNSLPFTYAFFLRNPTIESLYEVIEAGGDADTNASMLAVLLGARGQAFPSHLINGLSCKNSILETADRFCDVFEIP